MTTSEFKKVKADLTLRKRSSEAVRGSSKDESDRNQAKSPAKNLLTEFEKDETLEPNSAVFMDSNMVATISNAPSSSAAGQQ